MKKLLTVVTAVLLLTTSGCGAIEFAVSDLNGWDLSACVNGFSTCRDLFTDNQDLILGGQGTVNTLFPE